MLGKTILNPTGVSHLSSVTQDELFPMKPSPETDKHTHVTAAKEPRLRVTGVHANSGLYFGQAFKKKKTITSS